MAQTPHPHQAKRRIQTQAQHDQHQITNFFQLSTVDDESTPKSTSSSHGGPSGRSVSIAPPQPPAAIQASLLSVGMRVRKSVNDGYMNGKLEQIQRPAQTQQLPSWSAPRQMSLAESFQHQQRQRRIAAPAATYWELLPFCGIHKTGGLSVQTSSRHAVSDFDIVNAHATNDLWPVDDLTSSQESVEDVEAANPQFAGSSTVFPASMLSPTTGNARKRGRDEGEMGHYFDVAEFGQDATPSLGFGSATGGAGYGRVKAVPRRKALSRRQSSGLGALGDEENVDVAMDMDFEEADFLRPPDSAML